MGPLASRLHRAVCLFLIFCLLPWQEPARVFAAPPDEPVVETGDISAFSGLPPEIKKDVDAILAGPNRDAFLANARKAKLPDILTRLTQLSDEKIDPKNAQVLAARGELSALVKGAKDLKHDWNGAADAAAAYEALLAHVQKQHDEVSKQIDARAAAQPIVEQLREQLKGGPGVEGELKTFQKNLAAYMKSGNEADMTSAVGAMDALYEKAGIHDDGRRAKMFADISGSARAQGDALAIRAGAGDGKPFEGYQGAAHKVSDLGGVVPGVAPTGAVDAPAGPTATDQLRDAVGATRLGLTNTVLGGLVPGMDLRGLADNAAKLAERLETMAGIKIEPVATPAQIKRSKKVAEALAAAYAGVSEKIVAMVMNAPYRDGPGAASEEVLKNFRAKAWPAQVGEILKAQATVLDEEGPGLWGAAQAADAKFAKDILAEGEAAAGLPAARDRAKTLVGLLKAFPPTLDLSTLTKEDRGRLLGGQLSAESAKGHETDLGLYGQTLVLQDKAAAERRANGDKIVDQIAALHLTGDPEKDMAALDKLFENGDVAGLLDKADMPPAILAYVRARAFEKSGSKAPRPDGLPTTAEAYEDIVFADRLMSRSKDASSEAKNWANLYLAHYDVNRKTYAALCGEDAAEKASGDAAEFCRRFAAAPKLSDAGAPAGKLRELAEQQQALTELVKDFLQHRPLAAAMDNDQKKRAELLSKLRKLEPAAIKYLRDQGVDVDGLLRDDRKRLIASWLVSAHELGVDKDPGKAAEWEAARRELFGPEATAAVTAQSTELRNRLREDGPDPVRIAEVLNGMENPELITRGFAEDVYRLQHLERAMTSARDRDLLAAWQGHAEQLRAAADYYAGEAAKLPADSVDARSLQDKADLIRAAVADPKDTDRLLRAYRLSGRLVLDERSIRVGLDAQKLKVPPQSESDTLDLEALRSLMNALKVEGNPIGDADAAARLRAKLLQTLDGDISEKQTAYRGKQLLFSTSDQFTDQIRRLKDVVERKVDGREALRPGLESKVLSGKALQELREFLPAATDAVAAMDFATRKLYEARQTRGGRAELELASSMALLKAQTMAALTDREHGLNDFTAHGWVIDKEGDVKRVNGFKTAGADASAAPGGSDAEQKIIKGVAGEGVPSAALRPGKTMDGLITTEGGVETFVSLNGDYVQKNQRATVQEVVNGETVDVPVSRAEGLPGVKGAIDVRYDAKLKQYYTMAPVETLDRYSGRFASSQVRQYIADPKGAKIENLQRITIDDSTGGSPLRTSLDRTEGGAVVRYSNSVVDTKGTTVRTSVDLDSHSLDVTRMKEGSPIHQISFDLEANNKSLAASRRSTESFLDAKTGKPLKDQPPVSTWLDFDKDKGTVRVMRESTDVGDRNLRVVEALSGDVGRSGGDALLLRNRGGDAVGAPISATVHVDRDGLTRDQMARAYAHASDRASQLFVVYGKLSGQEVNGRDFADQMAAQMNFYDGKVASGSRDIDASFTLDPSGGFKPRLSYYDAGSRKVVSRGDADTPYTRYTPLPESAPQDQPNLDKDALFNLRYAQNLAAMRAVTHRPGLFVVPGGEDEPPTRFFDPRKPSIRRISYGEDVVSDDHWYGGNPINRPILVDGENTGAKILVGETLGLNNFHEKAGRWLGNYVRYQWKPFNDPKWDAIAGGIVDGITAGLLDPKLWLITAATMGGGLLVQLAAKSAITIVRVASTVGKIILKGAEIYFQIGLVEGGIGAIKSFERYNKTGNTDDLYAGAQGLAAMGAGFLAMHLAKGKMEGMQDYVGEKLGLGDRSGVPENLGKNEKETTTKPVDDTATKGTDKGTETKGNETRDTDTRGTENNETTNRNEGAVEKNPGQNERTTGNDRATTETPKPANESTPAKEPGPSDRTAPALPHLAEGGLSSGGTLDAPGASRTEGGDLKPGGTHASVNGPAAPGAAGPKAGGAPEGAAGAKVEAPAPNAAPAEAPAAAKAPADPAAAAARETATAERANAAETADRAAAARDASRAADLRAAETRATSNEVAQNAVKSQTEASSSMRLADLAEQRAAGLEKAAAKITERASPERAAAARERAEAAREEANAAKEKAAEARDRAETAKQESAAAKDEAAQSKEDASLARQEAKSATAAERAASKTANAAEKTAARAEAAAAKNAPVSEAPIFNETAAAREAAAKEAAPAKDAAPAEPKGRWQRFVERVKAADKAGGKWEKENLPTFLRAGDSVASTTRLWMAKFEASTSLPIRLLRTPLRLSRSVGSVVERLAASADLYGATLRLLGRSVEYDALGRRLVTETRGGVSRQVPESPGVIRATLMQAGQLLQGRPFPEGASPQTLEEIWNPRVTDRGSLRKAAPKEIPEGGAEVKGALDLATGRLLFGKQAEAFKGDRAEVTLRVEREGKKGLKLADYKVEAKNPADQARAQARMADQLAYELDVPNQQMALEKLLLGKAAADALRANRHDLKDESYVDVHYDAEAGEFRPGASTREPGARLRFTLDPEAGWRLSGAEPAPGAALPLAARYNLALAERVVLPEPGLKNSGAARPEPTPAEAGALLEARMRELDRSVADADKTTRDAADKLVADAEAAVARRSGPEPRELTAAEKLVAEKSADFYALRERLRRSERQSVESQAALDRAGVNPRVADRAVELLLARDRARAELDALVGPADPSAQSAAFTRLRRAQEDLSRAARGMSEGTFDAVVARHEAKAAAEAAREQLGVLYGELKSAHRAARDAGEDAALARAVGRYDAAVKERAAANGILELRRDGLHASVGADAAGLSRIRQGALDGDRAGGRDIESQGATERCVLAALADQISLARPEASRTTLLDVETAIRRIKGEEAGAALIEKIERRGMSQAEIAELSPKIAAEFGLETATVERGELFKRVAAGETVSVVLTAKGSRVLDVEGGPHMVNLSNWRLEPDAAGRMRVVLDMADPNIRVRDASAPEGAPRFAAKTVTVTLEEIMPLLRGRLTGFGPDAAGLVVRAKAETAAPETAPAAPKPPLPPRIEPALIRRALTDVRMDKDGPSASERAPIPDSEAARALRARQNFNRTPDFPNAEVFAKNSTNANDFFNEWLNGEKGAMPLREAMEEMHRRYAGEGEIGKGRGGDYNDGAAVNGRAKRTRDFVKDYYGLEPQPDGIVKLPGIPEDMSPGFNGKKYFYPDAQVPGMRDAYYKALDVQLTKYSELVNKIEAVKAADPKFAENPEYQRLLKESLDTVVDFGRVAAAFRQFKNGNWGLYGPMMNSMVNRLGLEISHPGFLDIILQGATEASVKPFFAESVLKGRDFYPADGFDPTTGKKRAPASAEPPAEISGVGMAAHEIFANRPETVKYAEPIRVRIGGENGKSLEIHSRADAIARFPGMERALADRKIAFVVLDPAAPAQFKGIRAGEVFELGRTNKGRFELPETVSRKHLRITGTADGVRLEDLGSLKGTQIEGLTARAPKAEEPRGIGASDRGPVVPPEGSHFSEEIAGEPESPLKLPSTGEKTNGLQQLKKSLEARGAPEVLDLADKIYYTDPLTGLPNRAFYNDRAAAALKDAPDAAAAMMDMNNFGAVNVGLADLHGVTQGRARADEVLGIAGATLSRIAAARGVNVVRLGGEEFVATGPRDAVIEFCAEAKKALTPNRLLEEAGMVKGGPERVAIEAAMTRMGRGGQPVSDFTYGIAELRGRPLKEAVTAADHALGHGKDSAGRGAITLETPEGYQDWSKPSDAPAMETLPRPPPQRTGELVAELEAKLTPKEKLIFQEAAFKDPLTMTRSYEFLTIKERDWNKFYAEGGMVMVSSARNLKQINDILGHDAGDLYLRKLGAVMRHTINKARNVDKLDVQEPVRVASKEIMLVGKDAKLVSELAAKAVAESFDGGRMLTPEQVQELRVESVKRGLVPQNRANLIGTLRMVSEPIRDAGGRADVRGALDRAFINLEGLKAHEAAADAAHNGGSAVVDPAKPKGVGTADASIYERYFSEAEILAAHREPASGGAYHDWQHTVKVADMAREFASARGLAPADVKFISEVGLLHDFDPARDPGMPARVPETLARLREDFAGTESLTGEKGRSILKERFGWNAEQLKMAEAMIQRTEFPFGASHPAAAYKGTSPLEIYENMLKDLPPGDRKFVLREGALLSEYADKSSWYATEDFNGAHKVVEGLVDEINRSIDAGNRAAGKPAMDPSKPFMDVGKLGTDGFLGQIGQPESFVHDQALAAKFGVELKLQNRQEAFAVLPKVYGRTFEANLEGFRALNEAAKAKDPAAMDKGRAAAQAALDRGPVAEKVHQLVDELTGVGAGGDNGIWGRLSSFWKKPAAPAKPMPVSAAPTTLPKGAIVGADETASFAESGGIGAPPPPPLQKILKPGDKTPVAPDYVPPVAKASPLKKGQAIMDSNIAISIERAANGKPLQDGQNAFMKKAQALGLELRLTEKSFAEVTARPAPIRNLGESIEISVSRESKEYKDMLEILAKDEEVEGVSVGRDARRAVGGRGGAADCTIVADVFFAAVEPGVTPIFVTGDRRIFKNLGALGGKNPETGAKLVASDFDNDGAKAFPKGFEVTVNGRTILLIPIVKD